MSHDISEPCPIWYSAYVSMQIFQPMPLLKRATPFYDPNWIFELKYDGCLTGYWVRETDTA